MIQHHLPSILLRSLVSHLQPQHKLKAELIVLALHFRAGTSSALAIEVNSQILKAPICTLTPIHTQKLRSPTSATLPYYYLQSSLFQLSTHEPQLYLPSFPLTSTFLQYTVMFMNTGLTVTSGQKLKAIHLIPLGLCLFFVRIGLKLKQGVVRIKLDSRLAITVAIIGSLP